MIDVELSAKSRILREEETIVSSIGNDSDCRHGETIVGLACEKARFFKEETIGRLDSDSRPENDRPETGRRIVRRNEFVGRLDSGSLIPILIRIL